MKFKDSMSKKLLVSLIVVVVVLIMVGVWVAVQITKPDSEKASAYSAVYMTSGDVYFGKMHWFPWPHLSNVWLIQRSVDQQNQQQLGLTPFTNAFWGPTNEVYLNPHQIVFWASVRKDSQLAKGLDNPQSLQPAQQQAPQQLQQPAQPQVQPQAQQPTVPPSGKK